ncbi:MAG: response regulator [Deltaproteobacteria bacterium]|nr:response regulator [Deltaproteobacteria bacterium]
MINLSNCLRADQIFGDRQECFCRVHEHNPSRLCSNDGHGQLLSSKKIIGEKLQVSEERHRLLVEKVPLGIVSIDTQGQIIDSNPAFITMLGFPPEADIRAMNMLNFPPLVEAGIAHNVRCCFKSGEGSVFESLYMVKWVKEVYLRCHLTPIRDKDGRIFSVQAIMENISEEKKLKDQLIQAQKTEAIGILAGGVAHEFNNILSVIIGFTELASYGIPEESTALLNLQTVLKASHRAKDLVNQILTFSCRSEQERKPVEITPIVKETLKVLRAFLPSTIEVRQKIESNTGIIKADPTQIHQVLMNLCTNAAHAMGENGGVLEVSLTNLEMGANTAGQNTDVLPGPYIRLTVSDTGHGMAPDVLEKIFDPYFTTKKVGEGTGLGLAVVQNIVKSHGGAITVSSEPGKGSAFQVYFPCVEKVKEMGEIQKAESLPLGGRERILFVDDEQVLADLGKKMLERLGYEVVTRTNSLEALDLFRKQPDKFHLVVTDMTMPNMTGARLTRELLRIRHDLPVILCTGFNEQMDEIKAKVLGVQEFVMKPFDYNNLANTIRRALDERQRVGGDAVSSGKIFISSFPEGVGLHPGPGNRPEFPVP